MQTTEIVLIIGLILQFLAFAVVMIGILRRIATKGDIKQLEDRFDAQDEKIENLRQEMKADFQRVDDRFAQQDAKFDDRFAQQDAKFESLRQEMKADFQRVDDRFAQQDAKFDDRFAQQDAKFDDRFAQQDAKFDARSEQLDARLDSYRLETKADIQRVEDRLERANEYHARSVDLLDAIRQQLTQRGEPL